MIQKISRLILLYGALLTIIGFATVQFFLILRHKSPYLSDSYFYKHIYYQIRGDSFDEAYRKILSQVDLGKEDEIGRNIFTQRQVYEKSFQFFIKRPFYPLTSAIISIFIKNEYLIFLIPIFFAYVGSIYLAFRLFSLKLEYFFAIFALGLFVSFYPFLDWSTYFLTDTIGFLFWLAQLILVFKYLREKNQQSLYFYGLILILSLLNREQSLLMLPLIAILYLLIRVFKFNQNIFNCCLKLLIVTFTISILYLVISKFLGLPTLWDTIIYTQNNYGLYVRAHSLGDTLSYLFNSIKISHIAFIKDLTRHHWWFTFFLLGAVGILKTFLTDQKKRLIDLVILSSGMASYLSVLFYPVLSYRFFLPTVIMFMYFAAEFIQELFEKRQSLKL